MMDRIRIKKMALDIFLGVYPEELLAPRPVIIDIDMGVDISFAGLSDNLSDTVDYHTLAERISKRLCPTGDNKPSFALIERVATSIADICLDFDRRIEEVVVTVSKPAAFAFAEAAEVQITRRRNG